MKVGDYGTDDVDFEGVVAGVLEGGACQRSGDASSTKRGRDFGVEEGHPSAVVGFELEVGDVAVFLEFESALCDFDGVRAHGTSMIAWTVAGHVVESMVRWEWEVG